MQYCPKCKTEYEDHATMCVDCDIELVSDLSENTYMKDLIRVKVNDSEELLAYLAYSEITKVEKVKEDDTYMIKVAQEEYEEAVKFLKVYVHEHMENDDEDDFYFDEYGSDVLDVDNKVSDMKSTVMTFGGMGAVLIVVALLNAAGVISLRGFNPLLLTLVLGGMGLGSIAIAFKTNRDITNAEASGQSESALVDEMMMAYKAKHNLATFYKDHQIKTDEVDQGALYFFVFDVLKKEVKKLYPDQNETMINKVVEMLYEEIDID